MRKLIINVALTGIVPTKEHTPYVPVTPAEIAEDARRVCGLGASMLHIHARNDDGTPAHQKAKFKEIIDRIRQACGDVIITTSTSGRRVRDIELRMEVLALEGDSRPDMASLTLGSLNFANDHSANPPAEILTLLGRMQACGIRPELEIFDVGMANYAAYLYGKHHLKGTHYANLILGSLGTIAASPRHLKFLTEELPPQIVWAATGVGRFAADMQRLAIQMGGHVRVGVEDSIYMDKGKTELATNEKLAMRAKSYADESGRKIATPAEARAMLGMI